MEVNPTGRDYDELLRINPLAKEQLKTIVLLRLLSEKESEILELKAEKPDAGDADNVTPIGQAGD